MPQRALFDLKHAGAAGAASASPLAHATAPRRLGGRTVPRHSGPQRTGAAAANDTAAVIEPFHKNNTEVTVRTPRGTYDVACRERFADDRLAANDHGLGGTGAARSQDRPLPM